MVRWGAHERLTVTKPGDRGEATKRVRQHKRLTVIMARPPRNRRDRENPRPWSPWGDGALGRARAPHGDHAWW